MPKPTLKHATADGKVHTRQTDRTYTHVVVGTYAKARLIAARLANPCEQERDNYKWNAKVVGYGVGVIMPGFCYPNSAETVERAAKILAEHPTVESYVEAGRAAAIAHIEQYAAAHPIEVLTWCGRLDLAQKAAKDSRLTHSNDDVHVEAINGGVRA